MSLQINLLFKPKHYEIDEKYENTYAYIYLDYSAHAHTNKGFLN